MVFLPDSTELRLLDVLYWQDEYTECRNDIREFDALSLRLESDAQFKTEYQTVHMHTGSVAFVPKGCSYIRRCTVDKMIVFHFIMDTPSRDTQIQLVQDCDFNFIYPMFSEALTEWTEKKPGYYYRTTALLYRIIGELCRQDASAAKNLHPLTAHSVSIIKREFTNSSCSVKAIARQLNISEAYLRRIFQQDLAQSPKQYMNTLRMHRARDLLNAGYDSVSSVSEKVGFSDPKNFATAYKKYFGYPPSIQSYNMTEP